MLRGVLVLCVGLLGFAADASADCDIATKIAELLPGFSPANYGNCAPGADCSFRGPTDFIAKSPLPDHGDDVAAIVAAYQAAPPFFQQALCQLDRIYVDTDTEDPAKPSVWGMRERLNIDPATNKPRTHIGISKQLLVYLKHQRFPYAAYEAQLTRSLLRDAPRAAPILSALSFATDLDASLRRPLPIAVLAILAHEMGHIVWWDRDVGGGAFPEISWTAKTVQHGFHDFGVEDPNNPPQRRPVRADVLYALRYLPAAQALERLRQVYSGEWASLFATVAPDEDFVETYKLVVLTDSTGSMPTRQAIKLLKIRIPLAGQVDILANIGDEKSKLHQKVSWVRDLVGAR